MGGVSERMKGEEEREIREGREERRKYGREDIVSVLNDHFNTV